MKGNPSFAANGVTQTVGDFEKDFRRQLLVINSTSQDQASYQRGSRANRCASSRRPGWPGEVAGEFGYKGLDENRHRMPGRGFAANLRTQRRHHTSAAWIVTMRHAQIMVDVGLLAARGRLYTSHIRQRFLGAVKDAITRQCALGREVIVERTVRQTRGIHDLGDAHAVEASIPDEPRGLVEYSFVFLRRLRGWVAQN
jgi:hypothetical protein